MMITETRSVDWTALGRAFAEAYEELDANELLRAPQEEEALTADIADAVEPEGTEASRTWWTQPVGDLRKFFKHEARDLTPWIAERLGQVQYAARIENELQLVGTEERIAGYRIDVLAKTRVENRERYVVIENQLEKSDADHLGRLISCAAEVDASHAIWIGVEFRSEHLKVLDGLRRSAGCKFIPLTFEGRYVEEGSATFDLAIPGRFPTPDDPMMERLGAALQAIQAVEADVSRANYIHHLHPGAEFTRYRHLIEQVNHWAGEVKDVTEEFLGDVPELRQTRGRG
ncbi:hypothetical protein [Streptomyces sp. NPDC048172]|uniref:hypothetical protein n=1 Tax=Streptomyces sp. NPDC048172 TaxID=3365505 RepID=UPI003718F438